MRQTVQDCIHLLGTAANSLGWESPARETLDDQKHGTKWPLSGCSLYHSLTQHAEVASLTTQVAPSLKPSRGRLVSKKVTIQGCRCEHVAEVKEFWDEQGGKVFQKSCI